MTKETQKSGKAPSHAAYHVRERADGPGIFTRIGAAWPHKDGKGFSIRVEMVPLNGEINLRVLEEQPA